MCVYMYIYIQQYNNFQGIEIGTMKLAGRFPMTLSKLLDPAIPEATSPKEFSIMLASNSFFFPCASLRRFCHWKLKDF